MKILLVEDDRKGAIILRKGLEEEGYNVDLAIDGLEAEAALGRQAYDLVILDWLLPGKPGIDVCRDLRRRDATTPVLMLTALDAVEDRIEGLNTGADDYLTKPFVVLGVAREDQRAAAAFRRRAPGADQRGGSHD